ncbi:lysophospholipid acyltransferase family protein [uncultured Rubinisphaera sp.]|uniref:lysophospholipid acyltransferase family protein n=1 Tax=uncultured Rubinisphaera sp. TaxID=1678686 RepID=UPI0030DB44F8
MRIRSRFLEPVVAWMAVLLFKMLYATLRKEIHFSDKAVNPYVPVTTGTYTFCVWHDSLLTPLFLAKQPATMALVGGHRDGTFLADSLKQLGIGTARGSTSSGGTAAVRFLMNEGKNSHLVLTPDGPRGPRREMKTGCAFLAAKTGKPVVPTAFLCKSYWSVGRGWTDLVIPKPFTRVIAVTSPPLVIPESISKEELKQWTDKIQTAMEAVDQQAREFLQNKHSKHPQ